MISLYCLCDGDLCDPAPAYHNLSTIEDRGLAWRDGSLRLIERDDDSVIACALDHSRGRFVAMANLHGNPHRLAQVVDRDEVHAAGAQDARVEMLVAAHNYLPVRTPDLNDVERRSGSDAQSLELADLEDVNDSLLAEDFAARRDQLARSVGQGLRLARRDRRR